MGKFRFPDHRHTYLVSHLLLRTTLSRYSALLPNTWRFISNDHGKPRIDPGAGPAELCFSLSHTKGLCAVAVTKKGEIGVDVEQADRPVRAGELGRRFFSPEENAALKKLPASRLREQFLLYWTLKEAYIKALGKGLSHPLDSFSLHLEGERPYRIGLSAEKPQAPEGWRFALLAPRPRSVAAICVAAAENNTMELSCFLALPSVEAEPLGGALLGLSTGVVYRR